MELSKREAIFTAIFSQYFSGCPDKASAIRDCWAMADQVLYHADRTEPPHEAAHRWINDGYVIVDTETTGLGSEAEIVEIAVLGCDEKVLLNTLVKPFWPIPEAASRIHGITNEMVADAPTWREVLPQVLTLISGGWVAYNGAFDKRMIIQSSRVPVYDGSVLKPECVMKLCAEYLGEWDARHKRYKTRSLINMAKALHVNTGEGKPHRALYDCRLTLGVIRAIAEERK